MQQYTLCLHTSETEFSYPWPVHGLPSTSFSCRGHDLFIEVWACPTPEENGVWLMPSGGLSPSPQGQGGVVGKWKGYAWQGEEPAGASCLGVRAICLPCLHQEARPTETLNTIHMLVHVRAT